MEGLYKCPPNHVVAQPPSIVINTDAGKLATWVVMEQRIASIWCLLPLVAWLLSGCCSEGQMGEYSLRLAYNHSHIILHIIIAPIACTFKLPSFLSHSAVTVAIGIDGYTHNSTLTSGDSVPLGNQTILVCQVVGLPFGTPLSYTWTCPNGPCEVEGYYGRKVYNEHILVVNTTSTSDGGTYTCQVTATGGQEATGNFTLRVTGMCCNASC